MAVTGKRIQDLTELLTSSNEDLLVIQDLDGTTNNGTRKITKLNLLKEVNTNITEEIAARKLADTTLQTNIDTEEAARKAAVTAETTARSTADTKLQTNITTETTNRTKADTTLQTNIDSEVTARKTAVTAVQTNLDNEVTRATNIENSIKEDVSKCSLITETGNKVDLEINTTTYELVAKLYDKNYNLISTSSTIDLPLETLVLNVEYDKNKKAIIITLKDGTTKEVPVSDLISDLINETTFNAEVERAKAAENSLDTNKQDNITDLETIRSGATAGATAVQDSNYVHTDNNFTNTYKSNIETNNAKISNVQADWNATEGLAVILNKPTQFGNVDDVQVDGETVVENRVAKIDLSGKQEILESGINIKTINNMSILGEGNIHIEGGGGGSSISVDQVLKEGTEIAGVTIDGTRTAFYAPKIEFNTEYSATSNKAATMTDVANAIGAAIEREY